MSRQEHTPNPIKCLCLPHRRRAFRQRHSGGLCTPVAGPNHAGAFLQVRGLEMVGCDANTFSSWLLTRPDPAHGFTLEGDT